jgi:hypothetical protein|nr:MAG TPA: ASCH domain protein [Bacteriophage sp.]
MKKIMFNDKFCLTLAVLYGTKTMTRRVLKEGTPLGNWEETVKHLPYKVGDIVAIAQSYKEVYPNADFEMVGDGFMTESAGWTNKMFVRADLMPHHIKITDVKVERLQDISDDEILREGIIKEGYAGGCMYFYNRTYIRKGCRYVEPIYNTTPMRAFASLIYKVCGGETWESNPWVVAYSFELIN